MVTVHQFATTAEAYGASQSRDAIRDGDVLVAEEERVCGVLVEAWPVAVTEERGCFHQLDPELWLRFAKDDPWLSFAGGRYLAAAHAARMLAKAWGVRTR